MTSSPSAVQPIDAGTVTLCLAGDVMTGRGVDQIFAVASAPRLFERYVGDAREYVALAERRNGPIARPVAPGYIWGAALDAWRRAADAVRIINLETAVTASERYDGDKDIHYRMHPRNVTCLQAASIDVCVLANNHVLDWGHAGLVDTVATLEAAGLHRAGAGRTLDEAQAPAIIERTGGRVLVYAGGCGDSGIPPAWQAGPDRPGVHRLADLSDATARAWAERIGRERRPGDHVIVSLHWGSNWGYQVPSSHVAFAHALVDSGVDLVHGHSSHHPRPLEVYRGKLILYGCGDLLNDYEGISGYEEYRGDLSLLYFATLDARTGAMLGLRMTPFRVVRMRLERAAADEVAWLQQTLDRVCAPFGLRIRGDGDGALVAEVPAGARPDPPQRP